MERTQDKLRRTLFFCDMPEMPQEYREFFNVAFMFRRKYTDLSKKQPESLYESAIEDMHTICEAYGNDPFCMGLLFECYDDIARKAEGERRNVEAIRANLPEQCSMAI